MASIVAGITAFTVTVSAFLFTPPDDIEPETQPETPQQQPEPARPTPVTAPPPPPEPAPLQPSLGQAIDAITIDADLAEVFRQTMAAQDPFPIDEWKAGYRSADGPEHLLPVFVEEIIPCESGYPNREDAATVVSRTNDVGFAQINMAVHRKRIETIWSDTDAVSSMQIARRNGHFTALLAIDSGTQPWYMSRHCHRR